MPGSSSWMPYDHRHGGVVTSREQRWAEGGIHGRGFTVHNWATLGHVMYSEQQYVSYC
jgi:hypothetical protein